MLEKKFDYQKEKSIVSSIAEEFVKKCINDGLTMKQLEILSEEVQERIRVSIERAKYETGVVKTNSAVSQCSNIPPCPQRLSETDLQPEIKKAMEKFVLRVLKGREDANPQETAILPEILKRLERR